MPRTGVIASRKRALRQWYQKQQPRPTQKACIAWFKETFNHTLHQSTVSEYLSDHYSYLDSLDPSTSTTASALLSQRQRPPKWPRLEQILIKWQQAIESRGGLTTGDLLVEKAHQIWQQLPEYANQDPPEFSDGWLQRFKQRHSIKQRIQHGESCSVPKSAESEMSAIRTLCGGFQEADIYNMDETGLFWRRAVSRGLSSTQQGGIKKDKARITMILCTNYTGSDQLPIWFIGRAQQPHALRGINLTAIGAVWRANKKAWMNQSIMKEWLESFYRRIGTERRVLLLMDNFKAHSCGLTLTPPPANIMVQWLPANATSKYQPLDQGIIENLKVYYRRQWLQFMIQQFEQDLNPISTMNVYLSIIWATTAWNNDVTSTTIYNCFRKSSILQSDPITLPVSAPDLMPLYTHVQSVGHIQDAMDLRRFLQPQEEELDICDNNQEDDDSLESIIEQHLGPQNHDDNEDDDPPPQKVMISPSQALEALQIVLEYHFHAERTSHSEIRVLQRLERGLQQDTVPRQQGRLDSWLI